MQGVTQKRQGVIDTSYSWGDSDGHKKKTFHNENKKPLE